MSAGCFKESLDRVLAHEGGYTNHPSDPGGPTNWGITIHDARRYWKKDASAGDVRAMPRSVACDIYRSKYWDAQRCDALPAGLDYIMFDYGVNSGVGRSGKVLRRVCGMRADASAVTDEVLAEVRKRNPEKIIVAMCDERLRFLQSLRTWRVFGKGWGRRVAESQVAALKMARRSLSLDPTPTPTAPAQGRATVPPPAVAQPKVVSASAVVAAGAGGALSAAAGSADATIYVVVALFVAIVAVAGLAAWWHKYRSETPMSATVVQSEGAQP